MKILIYGTDSDAKMLKQHMGALSCTAFRIIDYLQTEEYEIFLDKLRSVECDMIFSMMDNAAGMEGVVAAQNVWPDKPIIWFSNDKNFVAQSYRLGVTYFAVKPISERVLNLAIARCQ